MPEFPSPNPITIQARLTAGKIELTAEPRATARVDIQPYDDSAGSHKAAAQTQVEFNGETLTITAPESRGGGFRWRHPRIRVTVTAPTGSAGQLKLASADLTTRGEWRELELRSASGDADIEQVSGDLTVTSASGDLKVGRVSGELTIHTASGDTIAKQTGGPVEVKTASGDVLIEDAHSDVAIKSASGDTRIAAARRGSLRLTTVSGDVSIGVIAGTGVWLDLNSLSGNTRSDLSMHGEQAPPTGHELSIQARAVSGDIEVHRVTPAVA